MVYYQYRVNYINYNNYSSSIILTRSCEDINYDNHLQESKIIARQQIYLNNNNIIPSLTESVISLTQTQFNNIVKGPDDLGINPDIPIEEI